MGAAGHGLYCRLWAVRARSKARLDRVMGYNAYNFCSVVAAA